MNGPARIAGAAGVAGVLALAPPPAPTSASDAVQIAAPSGASSSISIPSFTSSNSVGSGLLPGIGYSGAGGNVAVVGPGNQLATVAGDSPTGGSGTASNGTASDQPVGDFSVLAFNVANGPGVVSQSVDGSGSGTTAAPQVSLASANSGATASASFAVATPIGNSGQIGVPVTLNPVPIGTTSSITSSISNQRYDMGFDNTRITSPADVIAPAGVRIMSAINPVPEPAMLAVLGVGLVGLGAVRRRKVA